MAKQRKLVGIRIGENIDRWFKEESERMGMNKSELMRLALVEYMKGITNDDWKKLKNFMESIDKLS